MSLAAMLSETVVISRYSVTGYDSTGDEVKAWSTVATTSAFVARSATSETVAGRDQVVAGWSFILPAGTDIEPYDRITHDSKTFDVVGVPASAVRPGAGEHHVVAQTRWVEG